MIPIELKHLVKKITFLKRLVKKAWQAGYEQGMEDDFHKNQTPFEQSMFYDENKENIMKEKEIDQ